MSSKPRPHWFRMVGEGIAIIVSILLAFAIDRWWEARRQEAEADELILNLHAEFSINRGILRENIDLVTASVSGTQRLRRWAIGHPIDLSADSLLTVFGEVFHPKTLDLATGVVSEVLASGRLSLIKNDELRIAVSGWPGRIAEGVDREYWEHTVVHEQLRPLLNGLIPFPPLRGPAGEIAWTDAQEHLRLFQARVLPNPEFQSQLGTRLDWATVNLSNKRNLLHALDSVLALLDAELQYRHLRPQTTVDRNHVRESAEIIDSVLAHFAR